MKQYALIMILLLLASSVHAGTLVAGSSIAVSSNYPGFDGLSLVGTWSTTPTVNDILTVSPNQLPANYGMPNAIVIKVPEPTYQEVLAVSNQKPLYTAQFQDQVFPTSGLFCPGTLCLSNDHNVWQAQCDKALQDWLKSKGNLKLYPGTYQIGAVNGLQCRLQFVTEQSQVGWVGDVAPANLYYSQDIIIGTNGTLHLVSNKSVNQLTDSIPHVGRATYLGSNVFASFPLQVQYIHAFQPGSVFNVNGWNPYHDSIGITTFSNSEADMISKFQYGNGLISSTVISTIQNDITLMKQESQRISGLSTSVPSEWGGKYQPPITKQANQIVVTLNNDVYTSNIQLVLAGQSFGLYLATGKPQIVSMDSSVSFEETNSGYINYVVKNIGSAQDSFVLHATCDGDVVSDDVYIPLDAAQQKLGKMRITSKSSTLTTTETSSCVVSFTSQNTKVADTRTVQVIVTVKDLCAVGQQTDPIPSGSNYVVNTLDVHCAIVSSTTCPADSTHQFQKDSAGVWQCKDVQGSAGGGVQPPQDKPTFSTGLFVSSIIVALIGSVLVGFYTRPLRKFTKFGKWIYIVLIIGVGVGLFFLTPVVVIGIADFFKGLFSFG